MVVKLSRKFESADMMSNAVIIMILTVINPLLCANMVCMSDRALVLRLTLNQPSFLSVYLNATGAFYYLFFLNIVNLWNVWYRYVVYFN